ncbi:MAG: Twin-arginine translocation pathway signal protein [uncultured Sulfurovum sp.]|uniref:Twin-arginine translocation pathway signal protein n=1 Tax=uncultured Sulfurovum sp. TaxID=269237 RepID=A0A6S6TNB2_9BACT|nr:MAG: Twin-arginine translocation pathway signal protein [uncultured Sulfurovum sp.]
MNRRNVLKVAGLSMATAVVGLQAKEEVAVKEAPIAKTQADKIVNRMEMKVENPKKPTDFELKHLPKITIKEKDAKGYTMVEITVGQNDIIHPSTMDHWIDYIELYADDKLIGKNILEAEVSRGATAFSVKLDGVKTLKSTAGCNLHGVWIDSINV